MQKLQPETVCWWMVEKEWKRGSRTAMMIDYGKELRRSGKEIIEESGKGGRV